MALEGGGAERHAARLGDQFVARQQRSLAVNMAAQPIEQRSERATADLIGKIRQGSTGGDEAMAAAGYYQGLPSVMQNGVYPSTQNYVNSVLALESQFGGGG